MHKKLGRAAGRKALMEKFAEGPRYAGLVAEVTDVDLVRRHASVRCEDGRTFRCSELAIAKDSNVDLWTLREGARVRIQVGTDNRARILGLAND